MNVIECTIPLKESHVQAKKIRSVDHHLALFCPKAQFHEGARLDRFKRQTPQDCSEASQAPKRRQWHVFVG